MQHLVVQSRRCIPIRSFPFIYSYLMSQERTFLNRYAPDLFRKLNECCCILLRGSSLLAQYIPMENQQTTIFPTLSTRCFLSVQVAIFADLRYITLSVQVAIFADLRYITRRAGFQYRELKGVDRRAQQWPPSVFSDSELRAYLSILEALWPGSRYHFGAVSTRKTGGPDGAGTSPRSSSLRSPLSSGGKEHRWGQTGRSHEDRQGLPCSDGRHGFGSTAESFYSCT
jgi:hypothetical protein